MRPHSAQLARVTCRNPRVPQRAPCGARGFAGVTQTTPLHCETRRPTLSSQQLDEALRQKRCITKAYIQRMEDGKKEWAKHAEEIKAGKRKNFAAHLEERGLIHDVVGYVLHCYSALRPAESENWSWGPALTSYPVDRERELLHRVFTEKRTGIYVGIDPTAPSMHVGHMLPFMVLAWGYVWGLPVTFLVSQCVPHLIRYIRLMEHSWAVLRPESATPRDD